MVGGAILGLLIGLGLVLPAAALVILGVTTLIGLQSWRLSVYLALAYLPVEGILWVAVYPHTAPAALAKDFLFVIPAYIGFFYWSMKSRRNVVFPGFPLLAVVLLAGLVVVEIFNPLLRSLLVGLVGAKVWLIYIPMALHRLPADQEPSRSGLPAQPDVPDGDPSRRRRNRGGDPLLHGP